MDNSNIFEKAIDIFSILCELTILIGFIYSIIKKCSFIMILYLGSILIIETMAWFGTENLFLFSISYYIHLFFLGYYILVHLFKWKKSWFFIAAGILIIPMVLALVLNTEVASYKSYDRLFYNFCIIILLISALLRYFEGTLRLANTTITVILVILFYFSIDFIIALTTNYLINEHLNLVGWIWLFRAFCLLLFYTALVHLTWKTGKTL